MCVVCVCVGVCVCVCVVDVFTAPVLIRLHSTVIRVFVPPDQVADPAPWNLLSVEPRCSLCKCTSGRLIKSTKALPWKH